MQGMSVNKPVEYKTQTDNGRVNSARHTADGAASRIWAEQGADISVGPIAKLLLAVKVM